MQLMISISPGVFVIADAAFAGGGNLTDDIVVKLSANAKFSIVRKECFNLGYFGPNDQVPTPISPVDGTGYAYAPGECVMIANMVSAAPAQGGYIPGQVGFPALAGLGGGYAIVMPYEVISDPLNLKVDIHQYNQSGDLNKGLALVFIFALRGAVNSIVPAPSVFAQPVSYEGGAGGMIGQSPIPRYLTGGTG